MLSRGIFRIKRSINNTRLTLGVALLFTLLVASIFPTPPIIFMTALLGAAPIVGSLAGRMFSRGLRLSREIPHLGTIGDEIEGRVTLSNAAPWPTFFARATAGECEALRLLDDSEHIVPVLPSGCHSHFSPRWRLRRRGVWQLPPGRAGVFDPLGLFHTLTPRTPPHSIIVMPAPIPVSRLGFLAGSHSGSPSPQYAAAVAEATDFHGIRVWQPGDSIRRVHWKSTARTGITHIIEWEDTLASDITVVLDVRATREETRDWFESAVTLAASIAAHVLENGHRFDLYCWQPQAASVTPIAAAPPAHDALGPVLCHHQSRAANGLSETLMFLATLQTMGTAPLPDLVTLVKKENVVSRYAPETNAVLIASSGSAWREAVAGLDDNRGLTTTLLLDEESYDEAAARQSTLRKNSIRAGGDFAPPTIADGRISTGLYAAASGAGRLRRAGRGDSLGALLEM